MKIQYLGTAAAEGWPGLFCRCEACRRAGELRGRNVRTRSQALIDGRLLLDFPCETYAHMLLHGVDLPNIHSCLITHCHEDHFYYLDLENRSKGYAQDMNGLLTLYGNDRMVQTLRDWSAGFSSPRQVDFRELARLFSFTGAVIKNVALQAAYLAADRGGAIGLLVIMVAVRRELEKNHRMLTREEMGSLGYLFPKVTAWNQLQRHDESAVTKAP